MVLPLNTFIIMYFLITNTNYNNFQARVLDLIHRAAFRSGLGNSVFVQPFNIKRIGSETVSSLSCIKLNRKLAYLTFVNFFFSYKCHAHRETLNEGSHLFQLTFPGASLYTSCVP